MNLIERIKPDILVKGSDYSIDEVVGGGYVKSYGGGIRLVSILPGYSTSNIINEVS